ncbi:hypothetical protein MJT46_016942 [Ovis ammon polii x Ovis aries]|nr:hypothetical protein MJT46_016942 [Ovis ammon polii x Ovis aries]
MCVSGLSGWAHLDTGNVFGKLYKKMFMALKSDSFLSLLCLYEKRVWFSSSLLYNIPCPNGALTSKRSHHNEKPVHAATEQPLLVTSKLVPPSLCQGQGNIQMSPAGTDRVVKKASRSEEHYPVSPVPFCCDDGVVNVWHFLREQDGQMLSVVPFGSLEVMPGLHQCPSLTEVSSDICGDRSWAPRRHRSTAASGVGAEGPACAFASRRAGPAAAVKSHSSVEAGFSCPAWTLHAVVLLPLGRGRQAGDPVLLYRYRTVQGKSFGLCEPGF